METGGQGLAGACPDGGAEMRGLGWGAGERGSTHRNWGACGVSMGRCLGALAADLELRERALLEQG